MVIGTCESIFFYSIMFLGSDRMLIDTHLHLNSFKDVRKVIRDAKEKDVNYLIVSGSDKIDNKFNTLLLDKFDNVFLSVGFHPSMALEVKEEDYLFLENIIKTCDRVVAIGEIGLDYHYGKEDKEAQIKLFKRQLEFAKKYKLPVVIHTRDAFLDTYNILKEYNLKGVIHCFSGSLESALMYINLGFYLGIGGVVTFKNSNLKEVIKKIGLERVVLETDSPYLSPFRGEENVPSNVYEIALYLSKLLNISFKEVENITSNNAVSLFDLKL